MNEQEMQSTIYDKAWREEYPDDSDRIELVRLVAGGLTPGSILDVGCGDGRILEPLNGRLAVYGCDVSAEAVNQARARMQCCRHMLFEEIPYPSGWFEYAFAGETIEHTIDTDFFLYEINRVLKPGGTLLLTYPNIRTLTGVAMLLAGYPPRFAARYRSPHYRDFTQKSIKLALENNGFIAERFLGCQMLTRYLPGWSKTVLVVARKVSGAVYDPAKIVDFNLWK